MTQKSKISISLICAALLFMLTFMTCSYSYAESDVSYKSAEESEKSTSQSVRKLKGVTDEMCKASYWTDLAGGYSNDIIMSHDEIEKYNRSAINTPDAKMHDIANTEAFPDAPYDASKLKAAFLEGENPFNDSCEELWVNGVKYENKGEKYYRKVLAALNTSAYYSSTQPQEWAVVTKRTGLKNLPTESPIGYSENDPDDENFDVAVDVNEPLVIRQKCIFEGHTFYFVYSTSTSGWVSADDIAVCKNRSEWLDAWQMDMDSDDFLVVTQDKIVLETSRVTEYSSDLLLTIGTTLKLVPDEKIPDTIGERGTYNNYVVYIPARDENGMYTQEMGLISQHCSISEGYVDYTQKNVLALAFSCLGNRYGWSGCDNAMDCSMYTRNIYRCMGFTMPRNTNNQVAVPEAINISGLSDSDKHKLISTCTAGTILMFNGHISLYTGTVDDTDYVISNTGYLCDVGETNVKTAFAVILNPLTVCRASGKTWLADMKYIVNPAGPADISDAEIFMSEENTVSVSYMGKTLYEGINYTVSESEDENAFVLTGLNNFSGETSIEKKAQKISVTTKSLSVKYSRVKKAAAYTAPVKVKNAKGSLSFTRLAGSKKLSINSRTGKIRVSKGTAKGTYSIRIKAAAESTGIYKAGSAVKVIKVKVR